MRKRTLKIHHSLKPILIKAKPNIETISNVANHLRSFLKPMNPNSKFSPIYKMIANFERNHYDGKTILKKGQIRVMGIKSKKSTSNNLHAATGCHQLSLAFYEALKHIEKINNVNLNPRICRETKSPDLIHSTVLFDLNKQTYEANIFQNGTTSKIKPISKEDLKKEILLIPK